MKYSTQEKNKKTRNEPICIEQMIFQKSLGVNGTMIIMVPGKTHREQNPSNPGTSHATV